MFSFRYKGKTFPAFERKNRPKVIPCASQSSIFLNTIGHLHIPAALSSEKEHLVPTRYETERGQNFGMGVGVIGNALFPVFVLSITTFLFTFLFGCLCFFMYEIPCLFSFVLSWLPPLSFFCLESITCTSTCSYSRFYSESWPVY